MPSDINGFGPASHVCGVRSARIKMAIGFKNGSMAILLDARCAQAGKTVATD
jgi:hypothetical protein